MEEKIFVKEGRNKYYILTIAIVVLVTSVISSAFTYVVLDSRKVLTSSDSTNNVKYEIESVENPVIAIAEKNSNSIVGVSVKYFTESIFGTLEDAGSEGSGIIYSEDGYIITNYHVIESAISDSSATVEVILPNETEGISAKIIGADKVSDLAVIKIDKKGLAAAEIGKSSETKVGELAVAIGNPLGQDFAGSVTVGYISAINRKITADGRTYNVIQTDAAINSGNSGGALVNSKGQLIGINSIKVLDTGVEGLGFAIPIDEAKPIIDELIENKKISRPYIGLSGFSIDEKTAEKNKLVEGVYIQQIGASTPASKAGLKKGDVIVSIDGKIVSSIEELNEYKNTKKVGDKITLKIYRQKEYKEVEVTLEEDSTNN